MLKGLLIIATLFVGGCSIAVAQERGSSQEQQACSRDVSRYCRKVMDDGDDAIRKCLVKHRNKLTTNCQNVLESHRQ